MENTYIVIKSLPDEMLLIEWQDGKTQEIPKNRFGDGEFVIRNRYNETEFCQLATPVFTKKLGWRYEERYYDRDGRRGGSSFWWSEGDYQKLSDPMDILCARKLTLLEIINSTKAQMERCESELTSINAALTLISSYPAPAEK